MTTFSSSLADNVSDGLRAILFNKYHSYPEEYKQIFNIYESEKREEKDSALSGFGIMPIKKEGQPIIYDDPIQGYDITYTHVTYGLGFRVDKTAIQHLTTGGLNGPLQAHRPAMFKLAVGLQSVLAGSRQ